MREYHILNLGAGVQSSVIYLMAAKRELWWHLDDEPIRMDYAIFADTQEEPQDVYDHLDWLEGQGGPSILRGTQGKIGDDLLKGENSTGQRFASIPAFTVSPEGKTGQLQRQCTKEYKVQVVERVIRRQILNLPYRGRIPKDVRIIQYVGFSRDEPGRAARMKARFDQRGPQWEVRFPLFDELMHRGECVTYLQEHCPHRVPKSSCVFCPYRSNRSWRRLRDEDPESWERACEVDEGLRVPGRIVNRKMNGTLYIHRSGVPLREAPLGDDQPELFDQDCEGGCGL